MKRFKIFITIIALFAFISMDSFSIEPKTSFTTVKVKINQAGFESFLDISHVTITVAPELGVQFTQTKPYNGEDMVTFQVSVTDLGDHGKIIPSLNYVSSNPFIQLYVQPYSGYWYPQTTEYCGLKFGI